MSSLGQSLEDAADTIAAAVHDLAGGLRDGFGCLGDSVFKGAREIATSIDAVAEIARGVEACLSATKHGDRPGRQAGPKRR